MFFPSLTTCLRLFAFCTISRVVFADSSEPKIPDDFLPLKANVRAVLLTPVSGDFRVENVPEVIGKLCAQLPINSVMASIHTKHPAFTGTFKKVPLRTALYQVATATGYKLKVDVGEKGQVVIYGWRKW